MKLIICILSIILIISCDNGRATTQDTNEGSIKVTRTDKEKADLDADDIVIGKELKYDQHTLDDRYPYKDTFRLFQWERIKELTALMENNYRRHDKWAVVQNRQNKNGESPLVKEYERNSYNRISDLYGTERYQSAPLYRAGDSVPDRYILDGTLVAITSAGDSYGVNVPGIEGQWSIPAKYIKEIDAVRFDKIAFVDKTNQNICTLERSGKGWLVRSMNPATTGLHHPPYQHETPNGIFVIQEKKPKMIYLVDGSTETGGFAPHASRFCNGAYIHGVPVNAPRTQEIEFSPTLGTTPRSHMCVRNATSHAKFVYDWAPVEESLVIVLE